MCILAKSCDDDDNKHIHYQFHIFESYFRFQNMFDAEYSWRNLPW